MFVKASENGEQNQLNEEKMEYFEEVVKEIEKSKNEAKEMKKEKMAKDVEVSLGKQSKRKEKEEDEDEFFAKEKIKGKKVSKK